MSAGIFRIDHRDVSPWEAERIRRACIEEGLLDAGELLDFEDLRFLVPPANSERS